MKCEQCGCCCRVGFVVQVFPDDVTPAKFTEAIQYEGETIVAMKRNGNACIAHDEKTGRCSIYEQRPNCCNVVKSGSNSCSISKSLIEQRKHQ
jgi:Fe-S-cluster containining protein